MLVLIKGYFKMLTIPFTTKYFSVIIHLNRDDDTSWMNGHFEIMVKYVEYVCRLSGALWLDLYTIYVYIILLYTTYYLNPILNTLTNEWTIKQQ